MLTEQSTFIQLLLKKDFDAEEEFLVLF